MRIIELQKKILKAIRMTISHRDLCDLCIFNNLSSSGLKRVIQDRLECYIQNSSFNDLLMINNKIEEYDKVSKKVVSITDIISDNVDTIVSAFTPDILSDTLLSSSPVNLHEEIAVINRSAMVVLQFTNYAHPETMVPTQTISSISSRSSNARLPNMLLYVPVKSTPFYCCTICLHPLSLLIPQYMPSVNPSCRTISHHNLQFSLSEDTQKLISRNVQLNNCTKLNYKWQVLLRFTAIDPTLPLPTADQPVTQIIPPYLTLSVNNHNIALWDVIPTNVKMNEGKRHPKPVNITEKLNFSISTKNGYRQSININWWQTPGVFQYYYVGVYLERKLSVRDILELFQSNKHENMLSIDSTLNLIKEKLCDKQYNNEDDNDDLVASSVLPINMLCPIGKSRIEIPLRTLQCKHIQCFDAYIFLSMNERREIWKCPICDKSATPKELFCDQFFQGILHNFKYQENVHDVNVSVDGTYVAIYRNNEDKCTESNATNSSSKDIIDSTILLDSDEEDEPILSFTENTALSETSLLTNNNDNTDLHFEIENDAQKYLNNDFQFNFFTETSTVVDHTYMSLYHRISNSNSITNCNSNYINSNSVVIDSEKRCSPVMSNSYDRQYCNPMNFSFPPPLTPIYSSGHSSQMPCQSLTQMSTSIYVTNYSTPPPNIVVAPVIEKESLSYKSPITPITSHQSPLEVIQAPALNTIPNNVTSTPTVVNASRSENSFSKLIPAPIIVQSKHIQGAPTALFPIFTKNVRTTENALKIPFQLVTTSLNSTPSPDIFSCPINCHIDLSNPHLQPTKETEEIVSPLSPALSLPDRNEDITVDIQYEIIEEPKNVNNSVTDTIVFPISSKNAEPDPSVEKSDTVVDITDTPSPAPTESIPIPPVSIDLTSDDDDDDIITAITLPSLEDVIKRRIINCFDLKNANEMNSRVVNITKAHRHRKQLVHTPLQSNSFNQCRSWSKASVQNKSHAVEALSQKVPIDLTGDDEEEDIMVSNPKKLRMDYRIPKVLQLDDNDDSTSSEDSYDSLSSPKRILSDFRKFSNSYKH